VDVFLIRLKHALRPANPLFQCRLRRLDPPEAADEAPHSEQFTRIGMCRAVWGSWDGDTLYRRVLALAKGDRVMANEALRLALLYKGIV
jgi:hypothetical protein